MGPVRILRRLTPASAHSALLTGISSYTVSFNGDASNHFARIEGQDVTLDLNNNTYTLKGEVGSSEPSLLIGSAANTISKLSILDGTLISEKEVVVGRVGSATGRLNVHDVGHSWLSVNGM